MWSSTCISGALHSQPQPRSRSLLATNLPFLVQAPLSPRPDCINRFTNSLLLQALVNPSIIRLIYPQMLLEVLLP